MTFTKLAFGLTTFALAIASAASTHNVTFTSPVWVNGTQLKAGSYSVEVSADKATFKMGKSVVQAPVTTEKADKKFGMTSSVVNDNKVKEIDLGGTTTKLMFATGAGEGAASGK
ncbi:MAG TPA: hypothetical protein VG273_19165 [Bryobacteraceae bacterium]|jgi:hypothetical protein|nr:hypothetical protein [Bryobacteraceae bacterium]